MSCLRYQDRLSDYLDGLLPRRERVRMEEHLRVCRACRGIYEDLLYIRQLSRELPEYEPSPQLWERIATAIAREAASSSRRVPAGLRYLGWRPALAVATAVMLMALVGTFLRWRSPQPTSPDTHLPSSLQWSVLSPARVEVQPTGFLLVHKPTIESEIVQQRIEDLERQIRERRSSWDAETERFFERCLEMVERSLIHCGQGLERDPENAVLRELHAAALKAKLELLKRFSEL